MERTQNEIRGKRFESNHFETPPASGHFEYKGDLSKATNPYIRAGIKPQGNFWINSWKKRIGKFIEGILYV